MEKNSAGGGHILGKESEAGIYRASAGITSSILGLSHSTAWQELA